MSSNGRKPLVIMVMVMTGLTGALTYMAYNNEGAHRQRFGGMRGQVADGDATAELAQQDAYAERRSECTTFVCDRDGQGCHVAPCDQ